MNIEKKSIVSMHDVIHAKQFKFKGELQLKSSHINPMGQVQFNFEDEDGNIYQAEVDTIRPPTIIPAPPPEPKLDPEPYDVDMEVLDEGGADTNKAPGDLNDE